jgi:hypothetical protein
MISDDIILFIHIVLFYIFALSPLITDCYIKKIILILIMFLTIQLVTKYGKCGIINIERFFIKEKFKEGFFYRLIKPLICYKQNIIYKNYFKLIIIYMIILYIQLENANCNLNIFQDFMQMYKGKL